MLDFPNTPAEGETHTEKGQTWLFTDGAWVLVVDTPAPPASVTIGDTLPVDATDGALHYLTVEPVGLFIYYDDGNSQQWVQTNGGAVTPVNAMRRSVNFGGNDLQAVNNIIFGGTTTSSDYVRWTTGNGFRGYENGDLKFLISSSNSVNTTIDTVGSRTTGSNANTHTSSSGIIRRSTSSGQYKKDIRLMSEALAVTTLGKTTGDIIDALNPVIFKSDNEDDIELYGEKDYYGFISEEVGEIVDIVNDEMYDTRALIAFLVAEVQSLRTRLGVLEGA